MIFRFFFLLLFISRPSSCARQMFNRTVVARRSIKQFKKYSPPKQNNLLTSDLIDRSDRCSILDAQCETNGGGKIENTVAHQHGQEPDHVPGRRHVVDHVDGCPDIQRPVAKRFRRKRPSEFRTVSVHGHIEGTKRLKIPCRGKRRTIGSPPPAARRHRFVTRLFRATGNDAKDERYASPTGRSFFGRRRVGEDELSR